MSNTSFQEVGKLGKTFGFDGALKLKILPAFLAQIQSAEVIFIETIGNKLPYFVEKITFDKPAIIKFEDINSKEEAQVIAGQKMYLELPVAEQSGPLVKAEIAAWKDLLGFQLEDEQFGPIGIIQEIYELPQQWMASIEYQGEEVLIPLNEAFVKGIDPLAKVILTDLPEGLLDV